MVHLLRALPFEFGDQLAKDCQLKLSNAFGQLLGVRPSAQQWALASLPIKHGGLGLLDPVRVAAPAHVSSFLSSSMAVSGNGLVPCAVSHDFIIALTTLEVSCQAVCTELRASITIGLPLNPALKQVDSFET